MDTVQAGKVVKLRYLMKSHFPDGTTREHPEETLTFVFGIHRQVPSLERALEGASSGRTLSLAIPPAEIYGEHDPALIREVPKQGLIKQRLKEGQFYRQMKMGSLVSFKVLQIRPDTVLADFNKPMAGIEVTMDLEVLAVRDATGDEVEAALEAQIKRALGCG